MEEYNSEEESSVEARTEVLRERKRERKAIRRHYDNVEVQQALAGELGKEFIDEKIRDIHNQEAVFDAEIVALNDEINNASTRPLERRPGRIYNLRPRMRRAPGGYDYVREEGDENREINFIDQMISEFREDIRSRRRTINELEERREQLRENVNSMNEEIRTLREKRDKVNRVRQDDQLTSEEIKNRLDACKTRLNEVRADIIEAKEVLKTARENQIIHLSEEREEELIDEVWRLSREEGQIIDMIDHYKELEKSLYTVNRKYVRSYDLHDDEERYEFFKKMLVDLKQRFLNPLNVDNGKSPEYIIINELFSQGILSEDDIDFSISNSWMNLRRDIVQKIYRRRRETSGVPFTRDLIDDLFNEESITINIEEFRRIIFFITFTNIVIELFVDAENKNTGDMYSVGITFDCTWDGEETVWTINLDRFVYCGDYKEVLDKVYNLFSISIKEFWQSYNDMDVVDGVEKTNCIYKLPPIESLKKFTFFKTRREGGRKQRLYGGCFPYLLSEELKNEITDYDIDLLKRNQIYFDFINDETPCFINVIEKTNIFSKEEIDEMKSILLSRWLTLEIMYSFMEKFKFCVIIHKLEFSREQNRNNMYCYGIDDKNKARTMKLDKLKYRTVEICEIKIDNFCHFCEYSSYFIQLITKICSNFNNFRCINQNIVYGKVYNKKNKYFLTPTPDNINNMGRQMKQFERKEGNVYLIYADTECYVNEKYHRPFCLCAITESNEQFAAYGEDCLRKFLSYVINIKTEKQKCIIFHNISYDGRFLFKYGVIDVVMKGNKIYSFTLNYCGNKIKFRDSYTMINTALRNFNSFFKLGEEYEKEIYPYEYVTKNTPLYLELYDNKVPSFDYDQIDELYNRGLKYNMIKREGGKILLNIRDYTIYYCMQDVNILKKGYEKFRHMVKEEMNEDIVNYLTISSLSYNIIKKNCLIDENIYEYTGNLRDFIRKAVVGGRCLTALNKSYDIKGNICDFDACSLYPSAMRRLFLPTGQCYVWDKIMPFSYYLEALMAEDKIEEYEENGIKKYISAFIIEIEIKRIDRKRRFPLLCKKIQGKNVYADEPGIYYIDNITFEELMKYYKIDYEVKYMIYWKCKEGVNAKSNKLSEFIKHLYDLRKLKKEQKEDSEVLYKLLMNSAYGKTIQKPVLEEIKVKKEEKLETYLINNYYKISKYLKINDSDSYLVYEDILSDDFFVPCLIGEMILSMSKRIMNEVMNLAEDNNIDIYYQDTDSMHIFEEDIPKLEQLFFNKYNRVLIGTEMGQFHSDFPVLNGMKTHSCRSIIIGKKLYFDKLINEDEDTCNFIRMKGIPKEVIEYKAKELNISVEDLYEKILNKEEITFDLLCCRKRFRLNKDMTVSNLPSFSRKIKMN